MAERDAVPISDLAHVDRTRHPLGQANHGRRQIADRNRQIAGQQIHRAGRQDAQRHRPTGQYARRARHGAIAARHYDGPPRPLLRAQAARAGRSPDSLPMNSGVRP